MIPSLLEKARFLQDQSKKDFGLLKKWTNQDIADFPEFRLHIQSLIAGRIKIMLRDDFNGLVHFLYRLDINENSVRSCFDAEDNEVSEKIAELYIERILKKYLTRKLFASDDSED
ncbi:MAG: hypothetical protein MUE53_02595 [Chitinophagales bacterium]|jgi:hypothetical protein|nr:hypothetical protein [Chitinophagales bacterium]